MGFIVLKLFGIGLACLPSASEKTPLESGSRMNRDFVLVLPLLQFRRFYRSFLKERLVV